MRFLGKLKHRNEGVGSIIGAVFIMLILLSGLTFYATYLNITEHYSETTQSMGNLSWSQNQEKIVIKQVSLTTNNNLNLTVENQGSVHSHLIWLGIFNKTAVPENQSYYALDESLNPSETLNITSNFTIVQGQKYIVQLVTELGNIVQTVFYPTLGQGGGSGSNVAVTGINGMGDTIPYDAWQLYSIKATTTSGSPIPYAYVAICTNGTMNTFQNAISGTNMTNPVWVYLDLSGTYLLKVNSASATSETFVIYATVGSVVGQKTVTQERP